MDFFAFTFLILQVSFRFYIKRHTELLLLQIDALIQKPETSVIANKKLVHKHLTAKKVIVAHLIKSKHRFCKRLTNIFFKTKQNDCCSANKNEVPTKFISTSVFSNITKT